MKSLIRIFIPLVFLATACLEKADPTLEEKSFFRIYDNAGFNAAFTQDKSLMKLMILTRSM
ncbi:MAG: hypothetical protein EBR30_07650 [Cytophagia bacterium]|nr:hypothetical protein [Cytophagia bacterium]